MDTNPTTKTTAPKTCACGCGAEVARTFLPGHDARLKGQLLAESRSYKYARREPAIRRLVAMGWGQYVDAEVLATYEDKGRDAQGRFVRTAHIEAVRIEGAQIDRAGIAHAHDACGEIHEATTPGDLADGWACSTCIRTSDMREDALNDVARNQATSAQ